MTMLHVLTCQIALLGIVAGISLGCVQQLTSNPHQENIQKPLVFGHIQVWQEQSSGRVYLPELASFEFIAKKGGKRYRLQIDAASSYFFLSLDPGEYQVTRVFIQEGGFRSNAEVPLAFEVPNQGVVYLGAWKLQIGSPDFTRDLEVTISSELVQAIVELRIRYPSLSSDSVVSVLAQPPVLRSWLYEITPYPRFRYFNRHNPT